MQTLDYRTSAPEKRGPAALWQILLGTVLPPVGAIVAVWLVWFLGQTLAGVDLIRSDEQILMILLVSYVVIAAASGLYFHRVLKWRSYRWGVVVGLPAAALGLAALFFLAAMAGFAGAK